MEVKSNWQTRESNKEKSNPMKFLCWGELRPMRMKRHEGSSISDITVSTLETDTHKRNKRIQYIISSQQTLGFQYEKLSNSLITGNSQLDEVQHLLQRAI